MKQLIISMAALLVIGMAATSLTSCENPYYDEEETATVMPDGTPVDVTFTLDGFQKSKTRAGVGDVAKLIDFIVFYGENIAYEKHQTSADADFGTITAQLTPGDYTIVAVAHNGNTAANIASATKVTFTKNHITDTFAYGGNITVTDDDTGHSFTLERTVAAFRLLTTDAVPDTLASLKIYYINGSSTLNPQTLRGSANSKQTETFTVTDDQHGKAGQWTVYTFPKKTDGTGKLDIEITGYDAQGNEVIDRVFTDVEIERGYRTVYEGNFFGGEPTASGGSFTLNVDNTEWNDTTVTF